MHALLAPQDKDPRSDILLLLYMPVGGVAVPAGIPGVLSLL